jgi:hypothetical protein
MPPPPPVMRPLNTLLPSCPPATGPRSHVSASHLKSQQSFDRLLPTRDD